jgi:hypothetical protein
MALFPDPDGSGFVVMSPGESISLIEEDDSTYIDNLSRPFLHMFDSFLGRLYTPANAIKILAFLSDG